MQISPEAIRGRNYEGATANSGSPRDIGDNHYMTTSSASYRVESLKGFQLPDSRDSMHDRQNRRPDIYTVPKLIVLSSNGDVIFRL